MATMEYDLKTPHFRFNLQVVDDFKPTHMRRFTIGDKGNYCLEATLLMPDADERFSDVLSVCDIARLDSLSSCLIEPTSEDVSFGTELLYGFIAILKANYPHITRLSLFDASFLPCNRKTDDTLDLLSYNIGLYGQTWYEMKFGARLPTTEKQTAYEKGVGKYREPEAKHTTTWDQWLIRVSKTNEFAKTRILSNESLYKDLFETSDTWPICFNRMNKTLKRTERCRFFKGWLESIVYSFVPNERQWMIDITTNSVLGNVLETPCKKPIVRKTLKNR